MTTGLFHLDDKVALVTGASSGLGRHFALTLARAGCKVAVAARRLDRLRALVREIEAFDGRALAVALDVTDAASVAEAVAAAETELGPIAVLVNNAGAAHATPALDLDETDWDQVMDTNLKGAFLVARETARRMKRLGHEGAIVNIASVLGERPAAGLAAYCASKAGLIQLTRVLALELARDRIRVNALAPGYVETDLNRDFLSGPGGETVRRRTPLGRIGEARDLDGALLLLASNASRFMTGSVITVDGGYALR